MISRAQEKTLKKVDHRKITIQTACQILDDGGSTKLVRADHKVYGNGNKPMEGSFVGRTGLKTGIKFLKMKAEQEQDIKEYGYIKEVW